MTSQPRFRSLLAIFLLLGAPSLLTTTGCGVGKAAINKYDTLVDLDEECDEAWANVEDLYQRRMDLLPNAVKIAKRVAAHEADTLKAVTEARASATQIKVTPEDLDDPEKMAKFQASQQEVAQSFGKLMHIAENYPQLKGDAGFMRLMDQLEGSENRISIGRQKFNKAVTKYNKELRHVSGHAMLVVIGDKEFKKRSRFKAQEGADKAPDLDL